jgi:hypothetical protein
MLSRRLPQRSPSRLALRHASTGLSRSAQNSLATMLHRTLRVESTHTTCRASPRHPWPCDLSCRVAVCRYWSCDRSCLDSPALSSRLAMAFFVPLCPTTTRLATYLISSWLSDARPVIPLDRPTGPSSSLAPPRLVVRLPLSVFIALDRVARLPMARPVEPRLLGTHHVVRHLRAPPYHPARATPLYFSVRYCPPPATRVCDTPRIRESLGVVICSL